MERTVRLLITTMLFVSAAAAAQGALFVKLEDLAPSGEGKYEGADIDAIELRSPAGTAAFYAAAVVASEKPANAANVEVSPEHALGQPVVVDGDAPYVFAPNGGSIVVRIDVGTPYTDDWRLTVFEVDGSLYASSGNPDPYRVSVAESADGPWRLLGIGSGTTRWTLGGAKSRPFDDERVASIEAALERELPIEPITEFQYTRAAGSIARLSSLDDIAQLQAELVGLLTHFEHVEHAVVEHGEQDGGRVSLARLLLKTAWDRYLSITGA
jgi:hypothetical protein